MTVALSPIFQPDTAQIDASGNPRSGCKLFTYLAGTSIKATTYKTSSGSGGASHANPIILDSNGLPPAPIWLTTGATYKFVLAPSTDTDPPASPILPTLDDIVPINDVSAPAAGTEWIASGMTPTYISASSFSVPGDQTTVLHVGRRLQIVVAAGTYYGTIVLSAYTSTLTTVTVLLDSGTLTDPVSAFSYGIASADNTSLPFISRDQQCGRLIYVSTTQVRLDPVDGNTIWVYSGSNWRLRTIPSIGIVASNSSTYVNGTGAQPLLDITQYWVYLFDNSGVLTLDFCTTAPAVDATSGLKIKTGDPTRLLVGMVYAGVAATHLFGTPGKVLSWYKRRAIEVQGLALAAATTASTSYVELQSAARATFLTWAEEAIQVLFMGDTLLSAAGTTTTGITLDGISNFLGTPVSNTVSGASIYSNASSASYATVTEGYHYVTITAKVAGAGPPTGTWTNGGQLKVLTQG